MNLSVPLHRRPSLLVHQPGRRPLWRSVVNCVWASFCFSFSFGCSAKWEAVGQDTTLLIMDRGEEVLGAEVPGEVDFEAFPPVEVEAVQAHECEVEAEVVAQDALINT